MKYKKIKERKRLQNMTESIEIIYEDETLALCHKPAGIATQTRKAGQKDMESLLLCHMAALGQPPYVGIIHRLDQPVEGVMVFAKNQNAARSLSSQIKNHSFGKHYLALVNLPDGKNFSETTGLPSEGDLIDYLCFDKKQNLASVVSPDRKDAKKAVLSYHMESEHDGHALLAIKLLSGRHHQIRIQLASRGIPICGDGKYGTAVSGFPALCACRITFTHPITGKKMDYTVRPHNPLFDNFL